jgi:two-component system sensor histidine kinase BarA
MHGVLGFTNLLLKSDLSEEQRHLVKNISRSASGLLGIINNILDYSKLEYENLKPVNAPFDAEQCCDEAIAMLAPQAHEKGLELVLLFYSDVPRHLIGDEVRIRQILINLISNAVKFTDQGEVVLRVMVEEEEEERCTLLFSLTDTGIGISPNEQKKLFQTFHQADPSARRRFGGTGLGLSICRKLVDSMGGEIGMTSELNEGSAFFVSLTLKKQPEEESHQETPSFRGRHAMVLGNHHLLTLAAAHRLRALGLWIKEESLEHGPRDDQDEIELAVLVAGADDLRSGIITNAAANWSTEQRCPMLLLLSTSEQEIIDNFEATFQSPCCSIPVSRDRLSDSLSRIFSGDDLEETLVMGRDQQEGLFSGRRVLVVDDNPINLELISTLLSNRGITVTAVDNGLDAVKEAEANRYDLMIMDVHMPDVSGTDAATRIRAGEEGQAAQRTPIIALTADITPATRDKVSQAGMDACLVKPLDENKFWSLFASLLKGTPTPQGPAQPKEEGKPSDKPEALPVYDPKEAVRITGGKRELAERMLHQFMDELDEQWQLVDEHYREKNHGRLAQTVHRLKGGGSICALSAFTAAAEHLEKAAWDEDETAINGAYEQLENEVQRLRQLPLKKPA